MIALSHCLPLFVRINGFYIIEANKIGNKKKIRCINDHPQCLPITSINPLSNRYVSNLIYVNRYIETNGVKNQCSSVGEQKKINLKKEMKAIYLRCENEDPNTHTHTHKRFFVIFLFS